MFACKKEQMAEQTAKLLGNRSEEFGEAAKNDSSQPNDSSQLSEVGKYLQGKGCDHNEIRVMQNIEKETYGSILHPINFNGGHFSYAGC
jgi:hypothetical protein